jgi:hypothetical protein
VLCLVSDCVLTWRYAVHMGACSVYVLPAARAVCMLQMVGSLHRIGILCKVVWRKLWDHGAPQHAICSRLNFKVQQNIGWASGSLCELTFFAVTWGGGILLAGHTRFSQVNPTAEGRRHCLTNKTRHTPNTRRCPAPGLKKQGS